MTTPVLYLHGQTVVTKLHRQIAELLDEQARLASVVVERNLEIADLKQYIAKLEGQDE